MYRINVRHSNYLRTKRLRGITLFSCNFQHSPINIFIQINKIKMRHIICNATSEEWNPARTNNSWQKGESKNARAMKKHQPLSCAWKQKCKQKHNVHEPVDGHERCKCAIILVCMRKFMERTTNFVCMHSRKEEEHSWP